MVEKLKPQPYRDMHDHPYCTTECHCWRAQREEMPDFCIVIGATPSILKGLEGRMCLPIIDQLCQMAKEKTV